MSKTLHGTITVTLRGEDYELHPTLDAYRKIQQRFGGLRGALEAIGQLNVDHLVAIIVAGAGLEKRDSKGLDQAVFIQGIADVTEQVAPFLTALFKPRGDDTTDGGDEPGN